VRVECFPAVSERALAGGRGAGAGERPSPASPSHHFQRPFRFTLVDSNVP
jgi:hypothetical protein